MTEFPGASRDNLERRADAAFEFFLRLCLAGSIAAPLTVYLLVR